ncbi:MAG TPA: hypothetical protein VMU95_12490 [Trebonia sp.]|nr:hypothetical protein [Trebonia sp.]
MGRQPGPCRSPGADLGPGDGGLVIVDLDATIVIAHPGKEQAVLALVGNS